MTSNKLCTVVLFMKDTDNVKNYCKAEVELNSILHRAYHIIDGYVVYSYPEHSYMFTIVCSQKQKGTLLVNPTNRYNQVKHVLYWYK